MLSIVIADFIVVLILTYLGNSYFYFKFNKTCSFVIGTLTYFLICAVNYNGVTISKSRILLVICLIYIFIQFEGKWVKKIFVSLSFFIIITISELIVGIFMNYFYILDETTQRTTLIYIMSLFLSIILTYVFCKILARSNHYLSIKSLPKYAWIMFILPIIVIVLILSVDNYYYLMRKQQVVLIIIIFLALSNFVSVFVFFLFFHSISIKEELESIRHKHELMNERYLLLNKQYDNNFNFLHNLLHKCVSIDRLIKNGDYSGVDTEVENLITTTFKKFNTIYSNSYLLNTIINSKLSIIEDNQIIIKSVMEYNDFSFMNFYQRNELFSILLDIAIDECTKVDIDKRNIIIKSFQYRNQIVIHEMFFCYDSYKKESTIIKVERILEDLDFHISIKINENHQVSIIIYFMNNF